MQRFTGSNYIELVGYLHGNGLVYHTYTHHHTSLHPRIQLFIASWNAHSIPNHGIPNNLQRQRPGTTFIHPLELPSTAEAVEQYRQQGGRLTDPHPFVADPLAEDNTRIQGRHSRYSRDCPQGYDYPYLFSSLVNGNSSVFISAVTTYASITRDLIPS